MANQVEIFNIDFGDTINSIEKLKLELKETKKLFEQAKPNTDSFVKYGAEVKRLDSSIKTLNAVTKENVNALGGINTASKFAAGSYGELKQKIEAQKKALLELNVESDEFIANQKELIVLQNQRIEIEKKIPSLFQERIKGAIDESNALKTLKADLKAAQSAALNGDGKAAAKVAELKDKIDDLKDSTKSLQGSGVERLNTSMNLLTQGFADFDADKVKTGFKGIGSAMSAIPLILLIEGIKALIENFESIVNFGKMLTGSFSNTKKAIKEMTVEIEKNLIVNQNLIATYDNQIALLTAQGGKEKEIIEIKKKKIAVQIAEAEDIVRLNTLKAAEILLNNTLGDSLRQVAADRLRQLGLDKMADNLERDIQEAKKERAKESIDLAHQALIGIAASKNALLVIDTEVNKKEIDNAKKSKEEKARLQKESSDELNEIVKEGLDQAIKEEEDAKKKEIELEKTTNQILLDLEEQFFQNLTDAENKRLIDNIAKANTKILNQRIEGGNYLSMRLELLDAEREQELANEDLTESQRAEIKAKYREQERDAKMQEVSNDLESAEGLTNSIGNLSNALYQIKRNNLEKGSEEERQAAKEQFDMNKAFSIASTLINGAAGVINAFTLQPFYLAIAAAAGVALDTAAQVAVIGSTQFQYFDGGYTNRGNPKGEAQSMGNAQFHNNEYVIPHKVLSTPKGSHLASQAESMRTGFNKSNIGGYFDGGFTNRSASSAPMTESNSQNQLASIIAMIPTPIVRVTDINKISKQNEVGINVSSL